MTRIPHCFARARSDWPGVYACEFTPRNGRGAQVLALWKTAGDGEVEIPVPGGMATLINTVGEQRPVAVADGKCRITLRQNAPVYLVMP